MLVARDLHNQQLGHVQLSEERCVYGTDYWLSVPNEGNGDTVEGAKVDKVDRTCERWVS